MTGGDRKTADSVLIAALAGGATRTKAAEQAGVSESTLYRRLADADFCHQVQVARSEMVDQVVGILTRAAPVAVTKLVQLMNARSETVQYNAARAIIELGQKSRETEELEARIEALEQRLSPPSGDRRWAA